MSIESCVQNYMAIQAQNQPILRSLILRVKWRNYENGFKTTIGINLPVFRPLYFINWFILNI